MIFLSLAGVLFSKYYFEITSECQRSLQKSSADDKIHRKQAKSLLEAE